VKRASAAWNDRSTASAAAAIGFASGGVSAGGDDGMGSGPKLVAAGIGPAGTEGDIVNTPFDEC
jgi:hypothetical protein